MSIIAVKPDAHVALWRSTGWILAGWALIEGANYTAAGAQSAMFSPSLYILAHDIPGGMRTHGVAMLTIAAAFLYHLKDASRFTRIVLQVFCGYCIFVSITVFGSWWVTHKVVFGVPWFWIAFAALSVAMIRHPPPKGRDDA